jgi:hypothetical protein
VRRIDDARRIGGGFIGLIRTGQERNSRSNLGKAKGGAIEPLIVLAEMGSDSRAVHIAKGTSHDLCNISVPKEAAAGPRQ